MTASIFALAQTTALYEVNVTLKDGEELDLSKYEEIAKKIAPNPLGIVQKYTDTIMSSKQVNDAVKLMAQENDFIIGDEKLQKLIVQNEITANLGSLRMFVFASIAASTGAFFYGGYYDRFRRFVGDKNFRNYIFDKVCKIVVELCNFCTTAYKESIIEKLNDMISELKEYKNHIYHIEKNRYDYSLYKDGVEYYGGNTDGWIARRVLMDKFPADEMLAKAQTLLSKINGTDTKAKKQAVCCIRINNQIEFVINGSYVNHDGEMSIDYYFKPLSLKKEIKCSHSKLRYRDDSYFCYDYNKWDGEHGIKFDSNCDIKE